MVQVAARIGYRAIGLRLIAVTDDSPGYPIMDDAVMMRETRAALADTGLRVSDIEFVKITPEINVAALEFFLAAGASLGARHVIAGPYDHDHARLSDNLSRYRRPRGALWAFRIVGILSLDHGSGPPNRC